MEDPYPVWNRLLVRANELSPASAPMFERALMGKLLQPQTRAGAGALPIADFGLSEFRGTPVIWVLPRGRYYRWLDQALPAELGGIPVVLRDNPTGT
ncbi:MAG: hypothetical protein ACYCOU_14405 [Sulfobacillus sp.]